MIISPDKNGFMDAPVFNILKPLEIDIPLVPITRLSNYTFREELYNLKKWVLFDYSENGANDWDRTETLLFGNGSIENFRWTKNEEWRKFDEFVKANPPLVYFKRELLKKDFGGNVYPLEYPSTRSPVAVQPKTEFNLRPISVFHYWGWSHESRRMLHGNFFVNAAKNGHTIIDNFHHFIEGMKDYAEGKQIWATVCVPHFARINFDQVMYFNGLSKLSVSLPGAGVKCFRHAESPINSVMVMQKDNLAWSFPWDETNSVQAELGGSLDDIRGLNDRTSWFVIEAIEDALARKDLYNIYLSGVENMNNYFLNDYLFKYIKPTIEKYA